MMRFTLTGLALILSASTALAGGDNANKPGVPWKKTWAAALEEAKLRNAPIYVFWGKDG